MCPGVCFYLGMMRRTDQEITAIKKTVGDLQFPGGGARQAMQSSGSTSVRQEAEQVWEHMRKSLGVVFLGRNACSRVSSQACLGTGSLNNFCGLWATGVVSIYLIPGP